MLAVIFFAAAGYCGWLYGGAVGAFLGLMLGYFYMKLAFFMARRRREEKNFQSTMKWVSRFSTVSPPRVRRR